MKVLATLYILGVLLQLAIWTVEVIRRIPAKQTYSVLRYFIIVLLAQKGE